MSPLDITKAMLKANLGLGDRADLLDETTPLLGYLPEFDSMAVVGIVAAIEDELGVEVEDEEIGAETFETVGSLAVFIGSKME